MRMGYIICTIVFILVIIIIIITLTKKQKKSFTNKEKFVDESIPEQTKTLKYFGGGYCPYSNKNSNAYNVIQEFIQYIKDNNLNVSVSYYWSEDAPAEMTEYDIMYVPTILGKDNKPFDLKLPDDIDKSNKTDDELKTALMNYIYNSL